MKGPNVSRHSGYGGRGIARNPEQGDVHGRLREHRHDLPAEAPPYIPALYEQAQAAFSQLAQQDQDALTGWIVASISKTVARAPYDGGPTTGLLAASKLAQQASQDLNRPATAAQIAGACLDLGFKAVTAPRGLLICAVWKDS